MSRKDAIDDAALLALRHGGVDTASRLAALQASDPEVADTLAEWDRQDAAIGALYDPVGQQPVPERLAQVLPRAGAARRQIIATLKRAAAVAALISTGAAAGWFAAQEMAPTASQSTFASAAFRAHATYSVEKVHAVEVSAADEPHLTNWLSNRLGQRIVPPVLGEYGLQLIGGRVVPDANGAAALLLYEDARGRRMTLYVAPSGGGAETSFRFADAGLVREFWWIDDRLRCAVVGDLPRDALRAIAADAYAQLIQG